VIVPTPSFRNSGLDYGVHTPAVQVDVVELAAA
jgi:hypothetical protein